MPAHSRRLGPAAAVFLIFLIAGAVGLIASPARQQPARGASALAPPVLIVSPRPVYPPAAEAERVTGTVEVEAAIDVTGAVQARVVKPAHPLLDAAALDAVRQYRYLPATSGGRPIAVATTIPVNFRLDEVADAAPGTVEPPLDQARRFTVRGAISDLERLLALDRALVRRDVPYLEPPAVGPLLHVATLYGQHNVPATITALLAHGANVNARDVRGYTPLALALIRNTREQAYFAMDAVSAELVALLLERRANVRDTWEGGYTPVLLAVATGASANTVERLLDKGADINAVTGGNATALMLAVSQRLDLDLVRLLLSRVARTDVRAQVDSGTALHRVFGASAPPEAIAAAVALLVDAKADVRARNSVGTTPLIIASWRSTPETIDRLVAAGANVNEPNLPTAGLTTPLHAAALNGKVENVSALLRHGADVSARDANKMTPLDAAQRAGHADVVKILQAAAEGR
jgi:TonB family protein